MFPAAETSPAATRAVRGCTLVVALAALWWTAVMYPTPAWLLSDHGGGYQLAAALEILHGRHPVLDFRETYGPLTFYTSAIGQWLSGTRVIGEFALIVAAFALSYALLFRLMLACGAGWRTALALTLAAILAQPAGYRYYLLLCPLLMLLAVWRYAEQPGRAGRIWLGLAVAVAGLFRPDMGAYGFVAAAVAVAMACPARRGREILKLALTVVAWAAPWLVWLAAHGKLGEYLYISSFEAVFEAAGRAKPPPWPDFSAGLFTAQNGKAFLLRLPLAILVFAGVMLVLRRRTVRGPVRAGLWAVFALAALTTLQGSHIVDWFHVRDTLPVRFLLLAWIAGEAWAGRRWLPLALVVLFVGGAVAATLAKEGAPSISPRRLATNVRVFCGTRDALLAHVRESGESFRAELYEYVRDHSRPDETVMAVLECPQLNYFADRRFASRQMAIFPGYFSGHQQEMMAEIRGGPTAFVVVDHLEMLDYPPGALERFAPDVLRFFNEEFVLVKQIGYCRVLAPRWRLPPRAP